MHSSPSCWCDCVGWSTDTQTSFTTAFIVRWSWPIRIFPVGCVNGVTHPRPLATQAEGQHRVLHMQRHNPNPISHVQRTDYICRRSISLFPFFSFTHISDSTGNRNYCKIDSPFLPLIISALTKNARKNKPQRSFLFDSLKEKFKMIHHYQSHYCTIWEKSKLLQLFIKCKWPALL